MNNKKMYLVIKAGSGNGIMATPTTTRLTDNLSTVYDKDIHAGRITIYEVTKEITISMERVITEEEV